VKIFDGWNEGDPKAGNQVENGLYETSKGREHMCIICTGMYGTQIGHLTGKKRSQDWSRSRSRADQREAGLSPNQDSF